MICFCPRAENDDDLLKLIKQGRWDVSILEYLIEIMSEKENKLLDYDPVELFEMQAKMSDYNHILFLKFWDKSRSGIDEDWKYTMNEKQEEIFDLFVVRIRGIYQLLQKLVTNPMSQPSIDLIIDRLSMTLNSPRLISGHPQTQGKAGLMNT